MRAFLRAHAWVLCATPSPVAVAIAIVIVNSKPWTRQGDPCPSDQADRGGAQGIGRAALGARFRASNYTGGPPRTFRYVYACLFAPA